MAHWFTNETRRTDHGWVGGFYSSGGGYGSSDFGYGYGVPTYGPGGTTPSLNAHLLNRAGSAMNELQAGPSPNAGELQLELPLSGLAPGEYVIEIKAGDEGDAKELVGFRVTG